MSDQRELRRLARGGLGGLLAALVSGVGGLAFIAIAARAFGRTDVGIVFTLTSLFLIALAVVTLGSDVGVVRFVAMKLAEGRRDQVGAVMTVTVLPVLLLSVVGAAVVWFLAPPLTDGHPDHVVAMVRLLGLFLPVAAVSNLVLAGTRGLGTVRPTILVESVLRQGLQPVLGLVVALATSDAFWLVVAWVAPYAVSCAAGATILARAGRRSGISPWARPTAPSTRQVWREVWVFNAPRSLTQIAQIGVRRADIPLVAALAGPAAAAVYTAASRFVAAGQQGIKGIQQMVAPQLARLVGAGRLDQAGLTLRTATTWNVLIAWPIYLTCAAVPQVVLAIFGRGYSSGEPVVVILALAMLVGTASGPVDIALLMLGRSVQSLRNNVAALATNLGLNLALIPVLGITGAALAWSAAIVVGNVLPAWQIRPTLGRASDRRTALAAAIAVGSFGLAPLVGRLAGAGTGVELAVIGAAGVVYLVLVRRFRAALRLEDLVAGVRRGRRGPGHRGRHGVGRPERRWPLRSAGRGGSARVSPGETPTAASDEVPGSAQDDDRGMLDHRRPDRAGR